MAPGSTVGRPGAVASAAADLTVQALLLFGSRASGTARPDSDLLVVERRPHLAGQAKVASLEARQRWPAKNPGVAGGGVIGSRAAAQKQKGRNWVRQAA